jgi:hypothetical protein
VTLAKEGRGTRALVDELLELEAQEDAIRAGLAAVPADVPDKRRSGTHTSAVGDQRIKVTLCRLDQC